MFTSISWQQYLLAVFGLAAIYYSTILLLYFRVELALFFNQKKDNSEKSHFSNKNILGEALPDPYVSSISNEDLQFNSNHQID